MICDIHQQLNTLIHITYSNPAGAIQFIIQRTEVLYTWFSGDNTRRIQTHNV